MKTKISALFILFVCIIWLPDLSYPQSYKDIRGVENKVKIPEKIKTDYGKILGVFKTSIENIFFGYGSTITYSDFHKRVYVCGASKIYIFDEDLNYIGVLGKYGQGEGEYIHPYELDIDSRGWFSLSDIQSHRITIYDSNFKLIKIYPLSYKTVNVAVGAGTCSAGAYFTPKGFLIFEPDTISLFRVFNNSSDSTYTFGVPLKIFEEISKRNTNHFNQMFYEYDKSDGLFCAFSSHPILRKYSLEGKLLCEADYSLIPNVKKFIERKIKSKNEKYKEYKDRPSLYIGTDLVQDIAVDDKYLYVRLWDDYIGPIYVFDKRDFSFVKKISVTVLIMNLDASHPQYIYAICDLGVIKIKK